MKLRIKLFISFLIVSLTILLSSTIFLINRSHITNVNREQERSTNEFEFIRTTIRNNVNFTTTSEASLQLLISRYIDYYAGRGVYLQIDRDQKLFQGNIPGINKEDLSGLLTANDEQIIVQIIPGAQHHYFMVAGLLTSDHNTIMIYARDINEIYNERSRNIRLSFFFTCNLILLLSILIFFYSKWITSPIITLQKGADAISNGNYNYRIPPTKDEFQKLGNAFNQMAEAVEYRTGELEEKAKELQIFIDDLSHEMNTPLTSIQGYAEFLRNANTSKEQQLKAAETIRVEAIRMKDIYSKLMTLTFAREQEVKLSKVNVDHLFSELENTFQHLLLENHIRLETNCSISSLMIDETLIHMLLSNLIKNSFQAMSAGGNIQLNAYRDKDFNILEVIDQGCGIPQDKINEVMKPFFRVDKSRSRKTGGAGLGLTISKSIAEMHQGKLVILSKEGEGTIVKVYLPIPDNED